MLQANKIDPKFLKAPPINIKELNDESLYYKMKFTLPVQVLTLSEFENCSFLAKFFGIFMDYCFFIPIGLSFIVNVPTSMVWTISNAI